MRWLLLLATALSFTALSLPDCEALTIVESRDSWDWLIIVVSSLR